MKMQSIMHASIHANGIKWPLVAIFYGRGRIIDFCSMFYVIYVKYLHSLTYSLYIFFCFLNYNKIEEKISHLLCFTNFR